MSPCQLCHLWWQSWHHNNCRFSVSALEADWQLFYTQTERNFMGFFHYGVFRYIKERPDWEFTGYSQIQEPSSIFWKRPPTGMKVDCAYWTSRKMLTTNCEISTAETMTIYRQHSKVTHTKNIWMQSMHLCILTHWGRVTHICISKLNIIGRWEAIIWTNAGILLIGPLGTNFSEILIKIQTFSLKKMHLKMSSAIFVYHSNYRTIGNNFKGILKPRQHGYYFVNDIFKSIFLNENYLDLYFSEICSQQSNWQSASTGSDNGFVPNSQQVIIWANDCVVYWCMFASLGFNEFWPEID